MSLHFGVSHLVEIFARVRSFYRTIVSTTSRSILRPLQNFTGTTRSNLAERSMGFSNVFSHGDTAEHSHYRSRGREQTKTEPSKIALTSLAIFTLAPFFCQELDGSSAGIKRDCCEPQNQNVRSGSFLFALGGFEGSLRLCLRLASIGIVKMSRPSMQLQNSALQSHQGERSDCCSLSFRILQQEQRLFAVPTRNLQEQFSWVCLSTTHSSLLAPPSSLLETSPFLGKERLSRST